jgi:hypothetical protein
METAPDAVSGRGSVMSSIIPRATVATARFAVAIVTKPAPMRRAALPARTAAPVLPTDPPSTTRWP